MIGLGRYVDRGKPMSSHPLNTSKVLWLNGKGAATGGDKWFDITGRNNHGALTNGPLWTPTPYGTGLRFGNGGTDYVASASPIASGSAFSVAFWLHSSSGTTFEGVVDSGNVGVGTLGWSVAFDPSGNMFLAVGASYLNINGAIRGNTTPVRIGATFDGAGLHVYKNGVESTGGAGSGTGVGWTNNTSSLYVGKGVNATGPSAAVISDVSLWSVGGTPALFALDYDQSRRGNPDLLRYYSPWYVKAPAAVGIAFDSASNSGYQAAASTYSWLHTCTGTNRYLAVDISLLSAGQTVTGITYNGVALTQIGAQSTVTSFGRVELWGLSNPASGSNTIAVTLAGAIASVGTAVSYTGVHQTSPTEAFNSAQATNVGAVDATVTITTVADNDWVHGAVATDDGSITANQTTRNNVSGVGGSGANEDTGPKTPAGTQAISYTGVGALSTWAIGGYAIRPIAASDLNPYPIAPIMYLRKRSKRQTQILAW